MATRTIGSGGDHADVNAWVAYLQGIDPFSAIQEGLIVSSGVTTSSQQDITGFDQGGFGWVLRANTSASFREHANAATNPLIYDNTKGAFIEMSSGSPSLIRVDVDVGTIKDLMIDKTSGYNYTVETTSSGNTLTVENCILYGSGGPNYVIYLRKGSISRTLVNANGSGGMQLSSGGGTLDRVTLANRGAAGSTTGVFQDYGSWALTNVAVAGFNTDATGSGMSGSHNATDKAAGGLPSTNRQVSLVAATEWEGATTDFRVKSTSVKLKDNGTGSSVDIIGQAVVTTADIGAWELQSGGGGGGGQPTMRRWGGVPGMSGSGMGRSW